MLILGGDGGRGMRPAHGGFSSENETSTRSHFFRISMVDHQAKMQSAGRVCISLFFIYFGLAAVFNY
jgi:hypothetical protein